MMRFSSSFISSINKNVEKECLIKTKSKPNDQLIMHILKLLTLNPSFVINEEEDGKKISDLLTTSITNILLRNVTAVITLTIQIHFTENYKKRENIIENRRKEIKHNTDPLLKHILEKQIHRNKEDSDQLYHLISCYINLITGGGDPTEDDILKETTVALKSILSSKEIVRFALKSHSVKEKQLSDVCNIVTGIRVYNKDGLKKSDGDDKLFSSLEKVLQKCNHFLDSKLREMEEYSWILIRTCFLSNSQIDLIPIEKSKNVEEIVDSMKTYLILLQQVTIYFRLFYEECHTLNEEFQSCLLILEQRLTRVRKTVKRRSAIPVVEIYPQFKDISLSWDKMQEITVLLNHLSDIMFDIWGKFDEVFERAKKPALDTLPFQVEYDSFKMLKQSKNVIRIENSNCELVTSKTTENFYNLNVEYSGFCVVTFVEEKCVLVFGIKEYGLIKFGDKYYCFSSVDNLIKFGQNPEMFVERTKTLVFTRVETITLLNMDKNFNNYEAVEKQKKVLQDQPTVANAEVQTDVHPIASFKDYNYSSSIWQLQQRIIRLADLKKCRTHSVQTIESNFRKETSTQTEKVRQYK